MNIFCVKRSFSICLSATEHADNANFVSWNGFLLKNEFVHISCLCIQIFERMLQFILQLIYKSFSHLRVLLAVLLRRSYWKTLQVRGGFNHGVKWSIKGLKFKAERVTMLKIVEPESKLSRANNPFGGVNWGTVITFTKVI